MIKLQSDTINILLWIKREWTTVLFILMTFLPKRLDAQGTTPFIEEIMIGRCLDYQQTIQPELIINGETKNCTQLWLQFKKAFSNKPHCSTSSEDFQPFIDSAYIPVPKDKVILWTGTGPTAQDYASDGKRFFVLSDTLGGFMANNLHFCGQKTPPGINYEECPGWDHCTSSTSAERSFWAALSKKFAQSIEGDVHVMLSGTSGAAYRNDSIFTTNELPNLNPEKVTLVHAYLIYSIGQPKRETCDSGTMLKLREDAQKYGLTYKCTENPSDVMYLLCVDDVDAYECKMISEILGYTSSANKSYSQMHCFLTLFSLILIFRREI